MRILLYSLIFICQLTVFGQNSYSSDLVIDGEDKRIKLVDDFVHKCFKTDDGGSTLGMKSCLIEGTIKMDSLLNIVYKELLKKLKKEDQIKLKISQRDWLKFLNSEIIFTDEVFRSWSNYSKYGYGSSININQALMVYTLYRERVNRLSYYCITEE